MEHCPDITRAEIVKLREAGIEPSLDELAELIVLGQRVENPRCNLPVTVEPEPLYLADRTLWPLTLQAEEWLSVMGGTFAGASGACAICYASERGRIPCAFVEVYTVPAALAAVAGWKRSCAATGDEIAAAAKMLTGEAPREEKTRRPAAASLASVLADLLAATGQPPEYWLVRPSRHMLEVLRAILRREAAAVGQPARSPAESMEALRQFGLALDAIRKRAA